MRLSFQVGSRENMSHGLTRSDIIYGVDLSGSKKLETFTERTFETGYLIHVLVA